MGVDAQCACCLVHCNPSGNNRTCKNDGFSLPRKFGRKFRRQTDHSMERWKSKGWKESGKRRKEVRRSKKRKTEKKEDAGAREGRKVAIHCVFPMICGSKGSKRDLALHYIALHYMALHYTTLHYITLRYTTWHYTQLTPLHYSYNYKHNHNYASLRYTTLESNPVRPCFPHLLPPVPPTGPFIAHPRSPSSLPPVPPLVPPPCSLIANTPPLSPPVLIALNIDPKSIAVPEMKEVEVGFGVANECQTWRACHCGPSNKSTPAGNLAAATWQCWPLTQYLSLQPLGMKFLDWFSVNFLLL